MRKILFILFAVAFLAPTLVFAENNVGYNGGFFIKNDEDTFKLKITGRVQPKFEFQRNSLPDSSATPPTYNKSTSFSIRRAQIGFNTKIHEKLSLNVGLNHSTNSQNFGTVNVQGVFAAYEFIPEFVVTTGMVGLPLSMLGEINTRWLLLLEPSFVVLEDDGVANFTIARASFSAPDGLGVSFSGDAWRFHYAANVINGAESNYAFNTWNKFSAGARLSFDILDPVDITSQTDFECSSKPRLTTNVGGMYQGSRTDPGTSANIKYMLSASAGVAFRWGGFALTTEGFYRRTRVTSPGTAIWSRPRLTDLGYYATAGYYIIPKKFEVALQAGQIIRQGPDNNGNQFGGGLNYYILDNNLKLQLAYVWTEDYDDVWGGGNNQVHNVALMASAAF